MGDSEGKICRYYNTMGGCWYGNNCKFLHIHNQKPPCKFFMSTSGCRFGDACHFSHDPSLLDSSLRTANDSLEMKETVTPEMYSGTNNNSMFLAASAEGEKMLMNNNVMQYENEPLIHCTTCQKILHRQNSESYCTLLKNHYMECFFEKDTDHIKNVRIRAGMEYGALYGCKICNLVFEKPWSLFQHTTDKARGVKVARYEKKGHLEWLDTIAGYMACYDLGLFSPTKLRDDLRENISNPDVDEDIETSTTAFNICMNYMYMMNMMLGNNAGVPGATTTQATSPPNQQKESGKTSSPSSKGLTNGSVSRNNSRHGSNNSRGRNTIRRPDPAGGDTQSTPLSLSPEQESFNFGFTEDEIRELLDQGVKPWDPEAADTLAILHGEYDHLLSTNCGNEAEAK